MKKVFLAVAAFLTLGLTTMSAQEVSGGIKANANMSNFILSDLDNLESNLGVGASLGGFMKVEFGEHFAIQPELMFHFKSSEVKSTTGSKTDDYQYFGAEIPVYAVAQMNLGKGKGFIGVGPYVGFGFSAKMKDADTDLYEKNDITDEAYRNRWDFGAGAILGYEFNNGIMINAGSQIGFINHLDAGKDDATMLPQTISLGVGYKF